MINLKDIKIKYWYYKANHGFIQWSLQEWSKTLKDISYLMEFSPIKLRDVLDKIEGLITFPTKHGIWYKIHLLDTDIYLRPSLEKFYFGFFMDSNNNDIECEISDCYEIEYLHEFQDMIYGLTKQELKINL